MKRVCVIGGGASGLMAAYAAAKNGNDVLLLEKNEKLGKKIYITGKGRCNLTNDTTPDSFFENVVRGGKFLRGAIYAFSPRATMRFLSERGLSLKTERGNRVFPSSDHASDVTKTLELACREAGVRIHLNETVLRLSQQCTMSDIITMPHIVGVVTDKGTYDCDAAIVCTGGLSYPSTGSTGDGYRFAAEAGHSLVDRVPALCGVELEGDFYKDLQGLTLKNVALSAKRGDKSVYEGFGELLFTHFGISGPLALTLSSLINRIPARELSLRLDFKPALGEETLDRRILRDFEKYKNKRLCNALADLLPGKLIPAVLAAGGPDGMKSVHSVTREERRKLLGALKGFPMRVKGLRGFSEAVVTSGGVSLSEINPKTMESKRVKGLYFCGEVLDADAFTGGFNLQIAFATGYAAGSGIK